ncbi:MAG: RidA family protein [Vicinamibacteria bacterium]
MARLVNPPGLGAPVGYSNGVVTESSRLLFISGQVGWDKDHRLVSSDFLAQFERALENFLTVVQQSGGRPESVAQMRIYVTDRKEYLGRLKEIGVVWRSRMGRHFPAMSLVEVSALLEDGAKVEIEGTAAV